MRTTALQTMLGIHKCTLLYSNGSRKNNHTYCTKKDDTYVEGPWYIGDESEFEKNGIGKRNYIDQFAMVCLKEGGVTEQIEEDFPGHTIRYQKHVKDYTAFKKLRDAKEKEKKILG